MDQFRELYHTVQCRRFVAWVPRFPSFSRSRRTDSSRQLECSREWGNIWYGLLASTTREGQGCENAAAALSTTTIESSLLLRLLLLPWASLKDEIDYSWGSRNPVSHQTWPFFLAYWNVPPVQFTASTTPLPTKNFSHFEGFLRLDFLKKAIFGFFT